MMDGMNVMCELILSAIDKTSPNPSIDSKLVKRGVVVEVFEDGHDYGNQELTHPMFRILKLPGVPMAFGQGFLGGELGDGPNVLHRKFKLDIDHPNVPAVIKAHLDDYTRQASSYTVDPGVWSLSAITALKTARVWSDPTVIGEPSSVIG
jgi:hypothetical protein